MRPRPGRVREHLYSRDRSVGNRERHAGRRRDLRCGDGQETEASVGHGAEPQVGQLDYHGVSPLPFPDAEMPVPQLNAEWTDRIEYLLRRRLRALALSQPRSAFPAEMAAVGDLLPAVWTEHQLSRHPAAFAALPLQ